MPKRTLPSLHAVVFDLDGTLVDTEQLGLKAFHSACNYLALEIPSAVYHSMVGLNLHDSSVVLRRSVPEGHFAKLQDLRRKFYLEELDSGVPTKPGAVEALRFVRESGLRCGLATSSERHLMEHKLTQAKLEGYFEFICTGEDIIRGKPFPDIFEKAAAGLGVHPQNCLAVEDSEPGLLAATQGGMRAVLVPDQAPIRPEVLSLTTACLATLHELPALIEENSRGEPAYFIKPSTSRGE